MFSSILREVFTNDINLLKVVVEDILDKKIQSIKLSEHEFGKSYSRPFMFVEAILDGGEVIFVALQDVYEKVMRKETIAYFLADAINNAQEIYQDYVLINFNLYERVQIGDGLIEHSTLLEKKIIDINVSRINEKGSFLKEFIGFMNISKDPYYFTSAYSEMVKIRIDYEKELFKIDNYGITRYEMGIRDRVSIMSDEDKQLNVLVLRAVELRLKYNFSEADILKIFDDVDREILLSTLSKCEAQFDKAKKILSAGNSVDEVVEWTGMHYLVANLAKESLSELNEDA